MLEEELLSLHSQQQNQVETLRESQRQAQHKQLEDYRTICQQVDSLVQDQSSLDQ